MLKASHSPTYQFMESPTHSDDATSAMELARNLPALVEQLKALRKGMERKSSLYDALLRGSDGFESNSSPSSMASDQNTGMRGSVFTPYANSQLDPRASQMSLEALSLLDDATDDATYLNTLVSRRSSIMRRQQHWSSLRLRPQARTNSMPHMSVGRKEPEKYSVMWVSGECGISLRNFSRKDNKVGAQIAVLQHAEGVTTGISACRLGDQLVAINDEQVDQLRFKEIVERLKTTQRPISLGFRTNPNMQTSPRAASSPTDGFHSQGGSRLSHFFTRESKLVKESPPSSTARHSVSGGYFPGNGSLDDERSDFVHETMDHLGSRDVTNVPLRVSMLTSTDAALIRSSSHDVAARDRMTTTSSEISLSDDVERWCREQEEMHCDIIVLLTETVLRCERLQQETLDQLQNLMQLSLCSPPFSDRSSVASSYKSFEKTSKGDGLDVHALVPGAGSSSTTGFERVERSSSC